MSGATWSARTQCGWTTPTATIDPTFSLLSVVRDVSQSSATQPDTRQDSSACGFSSDHARPSGRFATSGWGAPPWASFVAFGSSRFRPGTICGESLAQRFHGFGRAGRLAECADVGHPRVCALLEHFGCRATVEIPGDCQPNPLGRSRTRTSRELSLIHISRRRGAPAQPFRGETQEVTVARAARYTLTR